MLKPIARLIAALNGNVKRSQIAAGFSWGVLLGLVPAGNVFWVVLLALSFFFKHHHASKVLVLAVIKLCVSLINPLIDTVGWELLHVEALQPLFTTLYNMPFVPLTGFNNTLVAGGLAGGLVLFAPVFGALYAVVGLYRNTLAVRVRNSKLAAAVKKLPLVAALSKAVAAVEDARNIRL
jgi:uncharacterized protein (TIGR03546 family)